MTRWLFAAALLVGCGTHLSSREARKLRASVGVAAGELAAAADLSRVQVIGTDLHSGDPTTRRLGETECLLLQTKAETLGRETAAVMPLLAGADVRRLEQASGDLQGDLPCLSRGTFKPEEISKRLSDDAARVSQAIQQAGRKPGGA
ncbi:MAG: hypothetical protein ACYDCL_18520 [Myxococcales bacterium]